MLPAVELVRRLRGEGHACKFSRALLRTQPTAHCIHKPYYEEIMLDSRTSTAATGDPTPRSKVDDIARTGLHCRGFESCLGKEAEGCLTARPRSEHRRGGLDRKRKVI